MHSVYFITIYRYQNSLINLSTTQHTYSNRKGLSVVEEVQRKLLYSLENRY